MAPREQYEAAQRYLGQLQDEYNTLQRNFFDDVESLKMTRLFALLNPLLNLLWAQQHLLDALTAMPMKQDRDKDGEESNHHDQ